MIRWLKHKLAIRRGEEVAAFIEYVRDSVESKSPVYIDRGDKDDLVAYMFANKRFVNYLILEDGRRAIEWCGMPVVWTR